MTDVLRELNFNYATVEKGLNQYLARLNFDQSEEVTNLHASSQVNINVLAVLSSSKSCDHEGMFYKRGSALEPLFKVVVEEYYDIIFFLKLGA